MATLPSELKLAILTEAARESLTSLHALAGTSRDFYAVWKRNESRLLRIFAEAYVHEDNFFACWLLASLPDVIWTSDSTNCECCNESDAESRLEELKKRIEQGERLSYDSTANKWDSLSDSKTKRMLAIHAQILHLLKCIKLVHEMSWTDFTGYDFSVAPSTQDEHEAREEAEQTNYYYGRFIVQHALLLQPRTSEPVLRHESALSEAARHPWWLHIGKNYLLPKRDSAVEGLFVLVKTFAYGALDKKYPRDQGAGALLRVQRRVGWPQQVRYFWRELDIMCAAFAEWPELGRVGLFLKKGDFEERYAVMRRVVEDYHVRYRWPEYGES